MSKVVVEPVTPDRWEAMVELAERPGPRGGMPILGSCWCMGSREQLPLREWRKQAMGDLVAAGKQPGMLAYLDGVPMGWIAIAPRSELTKLERSRMVKAAPAAEHVYAITCFYVDATARGEGVAAALLDGAIEHARARGATAVEAYPNVGTAPHAQKGGRAEEAFSYRGRLGSYERRGFVSVAAAGARAVMRLALDTP